MDEAKKIWMGVSLLIAVLCAGYLLNRARFVTSAPIAEPPAAIAPAEAPVVSTAPSTGPLPALAHSDDFVRRKAGRLSSNPTCAAWLKGGDLIARVTGSLNMIARGKVPGETLSFLSPRKRFAVRRRGGRLVMDPRGYARYDAAGDLAASIDGPGAAKVFRQLKPLFQQAWRELGEKDRDVQEVLVAAAQELIKTPVLDGDVPLKESEKGIAYVYADEKLENLSPAQKQLLRMGPENEAKIQGKLKEIVAALGP